MLHSYGQCRFSYSKLQRGVSRDSCLFWGVAGDGRLQPTRATCTPPTHGSWVPLAWSEGQAPSKAPWYQQLNKQPTYCINKLHKKVYFTGFPFVKRPANFVWLDMHVGESTSAWNRQVHSTPLIYWKTPHFNFQSMQGAQRVEMGGWCLKSHNKREEEIKWKYFCGII